MVLFIIYLSIIFKSNDIMPALSYEDKYNENVVNITANFETGINSKNIVELFNTISGNYYIYELSLNNERLSVSCVDIKDCITDIYNQENNLFEMLYITNGFSVKEVSFLAYASDAYPFLEKNNIVYKLNKK